MTDRERHGFDLLHSKHKHLRELCADLGPFCQSLYSLLYNSISPKSFGDMDEKAAYNLASSARLESVSVYLPTRVRLEKATASRIL